MATQAPEPACETPPIEQGLELLETFMKISDPRLRQELVDLAKTFRTMATLASGST